jgi:hypothetical protein
VALTVDDALSRLHHDSVSEARRWGMSDEQANLCRDIILERIVALEAENVRLRVAFHDATRRPLGVTPDSGAEFYDPRMAEEAEARRPRLA